MYYFVLTNYVCQLATNITLSLGTWTFFQMINGLRYVAKTGMKRFKKIEMIEDDTYVLITEKEFFQLDDIKNRLERLELKMDE